MKKLLIILSAILLCITPFFAFHNDNKLIVSAYSETYNNTYNYTANISTDYNTTFLQGIQSVDSVNLGYMIDFKVNYPTPIPFKIIVDCGSNFNYYSSFSRFGVEVGTKAISDKSASGLNLYIVFYGNFIMSSYNYGYGMITGTLSQIYASDTNVSNPTYRHYSLVDENLSQFLDLDSGTNYSFSFGDIISYNYDDSVNSLIDFVTLKDDYFYGGNVLDCTDSCYIHFYNGSAKGTTITNSNHYMFTVDCYFTDTDLSKYSYEFEYIYVTISEFEMIINKPVTRLDNSLVLYNYDYDCAISSISSIEYALSKDNDLYKAKYIGTLPNSKYIGIVSADLQNRIYDEYIYVYLTFNGNKLNLDNNGCFQLGFDFNFSRYYEPFVIKDTELNSYNLPDLNKPDDWYDFGGWIRYAFIWLLFYNPIIAPISKFIVSIFGVFINVIKFILGFELGSFLLAFIGFIILYNFFVSISPIQSAWKGIGALDSELDNYCDDYRQYKEEHKYDKTYNTLRDTKKVSKLRTKVKDKWNKNSVKVQKKFDKKRSKKK